MAKLTINIPDEKVDLILGAFDSHERYGPRGEELYTKAEWAKLRVIAYLKDMVRAKMEESTRGAVAREVESIEIT